MQNVVSTLPDSKDRAKFATILEGREEAVVLNNHQHSPVKSSGTGDQGTEPLLFALWKTAKSQQKESRF